MILKLRQRMAQEESGFTLVELLVVMLILGLLAAIAIPAFFNQKSKANDADAKSTANTAQTALETWATDNQGSYSGATVADLVGVESTLTGAQARIALTDSGGTGTPGQKSYRVTVTSTNGDTFSIDRASSGAATYPCTPAGTGGCPGSGGGTGNWGP